ncbi:hypothetical protein GCM10028807_62940 [Spirosoma daeguense]
MIDKSDKLVIFDLDETLIHATEHELNKPYDLKFEKYFVYQRPNLRSFLTSAAEHFTVGIWSSADDDYVTEIVRGIIPDNIDLLVVWGRSRCSYRRDFERDTYCFEKRLDKLKKRGFRLEKILIVDDSTEKSRANYGNAIHIKEYIGDENDNELTALFDYLLTLKAVENVRSIEKRGWRNRVESTSIG